MRQAAHRSWSRAARLTGAALAVALSTIPSAHAAPDPGGDGALISLLDGFERFEQGCRTFPAPPGDPVNGVAAGAPQRVPGRFGEALALVKAGQSVAYPQRGVLSPQLGSLAAWIRVPPLPAATAAAAPVVRYVFQCGEDKANGLHCYVEGQDQIALVIYGPDGKAQSVKHALQARGSWLHVAVSWEPAAATLFVGGRPVGKIERPALPVRFDGPLYAGNDQWGDKPLRGAIDEITAWAVPRKSFVLGKPADAGEAMRTRALSAGSRDAALRQTVLPFLTGLSGRGSHEATFHLGHARIALGDFADARTTFWDVKRSAEDPGLKTYADFGVAEAFAEEGAYESALELLQGLARSAKPDTAAYAEYWTGKVYLMMKDYAKAFLQCEKLIATYPENIWANYAYYSSGTGHFELKDYERALGAFRLVGTAGSTRMQVAELGEPIQIRVADADLLARTDSKKLRVRIAADSGDTEWLAMDAAESRGVYIGHMLPELGSPSPNDGALQVLGSDCVRVSYEDDTRPADARDRDVVEELPVVDDGALEILKDIYPGRLSELAALVEAGTIEAETYRVLKPLPLSASQELRDAVDEDAEVFNVAALRRSLQRPTLKPGQAFYTEVQDGDGDGSDEADTVPVTFTTTSGETTDFALVETGPHTGVFGARIPTRPPGTAPADGLALAVAIKDKVTAKYTDSENVRPGKPTTRSASIDVQYADAVITVNKLVPELEASIPVVRFMPGDILEIRADDKDRDVTDRPDELQVVVTSSSGDRETVTLFETMDNSGIFTGTVRTREGEPKPGDGIVQMKGGDEIAVQYDDAENSESTEAVTRETTAKGLEATVAVVEILSEDGAPVTVVAPGDTLLVRITDPDAVQTGDETGTVTVASSGGHELMLGVAVSEEGLESGILRETELLQVTLGDAGSPDTVVLREEETGGLVQQRPVRVVNVMGDDTVTVTYVDAMAPGGARDVPRECSVRIAATAELELTRPPSTLEVEQIKPGDRLAVRVSDGDRDVSRDRDRAAIVIEAESGDKVELSAGETLAHSGVFDATFSTRLGPSEPGDTVLSVDLGDAVRIVYNDTRSLTSDVPAELVKTVHVIAGADGELAVFSKSFLDEELAAETYVTLAESYYRVGVRRLLTEDTPAEEIDQLARSVDLADRVVRRRPDTDQAVAARMLAADVHRALGRYEEAIRAYDGVAASVHRTRQREAELRALGAETDEEGDDKLEAMAAYALYQIGVAYFDQGDVDEASRAWARLIYRYPDSPLVPKAVLRKGDAFYRDKDHARAAKVFEKFVEYHPDHALVDKVLYKAGLCYYLMKNYKKAGELYSGLLLDYPHSSLAGDAQYWLGETLYHGGQRNKALVEFQRVLNDYPTCQWRQQAQLRVIELE